MQQSHSGVHQKRTKQVYRDLLEEFAFKRTLEWFVCGENAIGPQTDPTAKRTAHFWINQLRCALWDEEVFVDSLQFSMVGRGQTWGCEEVQSLIEIWSDDHIKSQLSKTHKNSAVFSLFGNPRSCLSIIAVCCLMHFTPVFVYFRWAPLEFSRTPIEKQFRECVQRHI